MYRIAKEWAFTPVGPIRVLQIGVGTITRRMDAFELLITLLKL